MVRNSVVVRHVSKGLGSLSCLQRRGCERTREVNGAIVVSVDLVDHILQLRLGRVLTQRSHDGAELLSGNLS